MTGHRRWRERAEHALVIVAVALVVLALSVWPLARLALEAIAPDGVPSLDTIARVLSSEATWTAARYSLVTAVGGTIVATVVGTVVALLVSLTDLRARHAYVFCFVLPLMLAPQVVALAWLQLFGPSSTLLKLAGIAPAPGSRNPLYSVGGIVVLLGVQYAPLVFLTLRAGLRALPREMVEAALASGATPLRVVRTVVLPLMTPPLAAGIALCFVSCLGNFGIPAFLGIPGNVPVLPTLIYQRLAGLGPDLLSEVAVLSMLVGAIACAGVALHAKLLPGGDFRITTASIEPRAFALGRLRLPVEIALWTLSFVVLVLPLAALALTSLVPAVGVALDATSATIDNYRFVLLEHDGSRRAFRNSFGLSLTAAVAIVAAAVPLGYFVAWGRARGLRLVTLAVELPYALPGVVLAIAAILVFLEPLPLLGITLYNTVWIILFGYLARFLVLGLRPVVGGYQQIDRTLEEAAQVAGARLLRRMRTVLLPMLAPAAGAGMLLIFMTAFNELTVSALLWSSGAETLGVMLFSFQQGGDSTYAAALASLTVVVTVVLMLAAVSLGRRLPAGVVPWRG